MTKESSTMLVESRGRKMNLSLKNRKKGGWVRVADGAPREAGAGGVFRRLERSPESFK